MNKQFHPTWRINEAIRAREVRVIGEDNKQIGVMTREEALARAKELSVDLIEIVPHAEPPVTKLIDFGKFRYQEEKKEREVKKKAKGGELKEIRFTPFIGEGDFETRIRRIEEFLGDSNKVRIVVVFNNRQMAGPANGFALVKRVLARFEDRTIVDMEPKFFGKRLVCVISPTKKVKKQEEMI